MYCLSYLKELIPSDECGLKEIIKSCVQLLIKLKTMWIWGICYAIYVIGYNSFRNAHWNFVNREKNQADDPIAKNATHQNVSALYFHLPPVWLINFLYYPFTI